MLFVALKSQFVEIDSDLQETFFTLDLADIISTVLGSFTKTLYRVREDVDTGHVNQVCLFVTGQDGSPSFLKQSLYRLIVTEPFNSMMAPIAKRRNSSSLATRAVRVHFGETVAVTTHPKR